MGQSLSAIPNPASSDLAQLRMVLTCDVAGDRQTQIVGTDYIAMRRSATEQGWRRSAAGVWSCPACSDTQRKPDLFAL